MGRGASFFAALGTTFTPLKIPAFRRLWFGTLCSNSAQQLQTVAAAWMMVQIAPSPDKVAQVQTMSALPIMLLALPSGSLADLYDRRKVAMVAVLIGLCGALMLAIASAQGVVTPTLILVACALAGTGSALLSPAWQSSLVELVGRDSLASGVALNATSANLSRSIGASLGGVLIIALGATVSFAINAACYIPLLFALLLWRRTVVPSHLPVESIGSATWAGLKYAALSRASLRILFRATCSAFGTSAIYALLPFVATTILHGDASTYGFLLGAFGMGAVVSGIFAGLLRGRLEAEASVRLYSIIQGVGIAILAISPFLSLSVVAVFICGACWVTNTAVYNVSTQLRSPRWVAGRMIALFYAAVAGGLGIGSWCWGHVATATSIPIALLCAGILLFLMPLFGLWAPLPGKPEGDGTSVSSTSIPSVEVDIQGFSGPVQIDVYYVIDPADEAQFCVLMRRMRRIRQRNGAYGVRLYRDIAMPSHWIEQSHYATWHDYIRARDRPTAAERALQSEVLALDKGGIDGPQVRRLIDRTILATRAPAVLEVGTPA